MQVGITNGKGILLGKIFPLAQGMGKNIAESTGKTLDKINILIPGYPFMTPAQVPIIIKQGFIICTHVQ